MLVAPIPDYEPERIASLRRMALLSTPDEERFDRVTRTAQKLFQVPIALLSLIDSDRQWFKSCVGLPVRETGRDVSFCGHAILEDDLFVIENALADVRFADNPLVTGDPKVIFYAGRPLKNTEGFTIGTLCVIDHEPRAFGHQERQSLNDLGHWLETELLNQELGDMERSLINELDEVRRNSLLDPMLNVWGEAAIQDLFGREVDRAFHARSALGVLYLQVDGFQALQQTVLTNPLLIEVAKRVRPLLHAYDSLGYLGRGRFLVLLPNSTPAEVSRLALRLCRAAGMYPMLHDETIHEFTVSIAACSLDYAAVTPEPAVVLESLARAATEAEAAGGDRIRMLTEFT